MTEIEVKILNINKEEIIKKLLALGAEAWPRALITEKGFDFPNRTFGRRGHSLRLRQVGEQVELTYKNATQKGKLFKMREETETIVSDFATMEKILNKLGLRCFRHRQKYRTSFKLGNTHFEIDEYPGIPAYLEIESDKYNILKYTKVLGYTHEQTSSASAASVLKKYHVNKDFLIFND